MDQALSRELRYVASSVDNYVPPGVFAQMPPTQTNRIAKLRFLTDPLPHDLLVAGPSVLNLFCGDRRRRHQLDHCSEGRWTGSNGAYRA